MGFSLTSMFDPMGMFGGGGEAADTSLEASRLQADYQQQALDYLKQREAMPQMFREGALQQLAGLYGLEGGTGNQQAMIDQAMSSPLYRAIMGGQSAGEEAILRNAGMTGGLRSGNIQQGLADYNTQLQNQALLQAYNQQVGGLQGLAELPSLAQPIASGMAGIGQTLAQGQIAAGQAQQAGQQNMFGNLMGVGNLFASLYGSGMF